MVTYKNMEETLPPMIYAYLSSKGNESHGAQELYALFFPHISTCPTLDHSVNLGHQLMDLICKEIAVHKEVQVIRADQEQDRRERLRQEISENIASELVSVDLQEEVNRIRTTVEAIGTPDELMKLDASITKMYEDIGKRGGRAAVFMTNELADYDSEAGTLLSHKNTSFYSMNKKLVQTQPTDDEEDNVLVTIDANTFPSRVLPNIAFVRYDITNGFYIADIHNDSAVKLMQSYQFQKALPVLKAVSLTPILHYQEDTQDVEIVCKGYHKPSRTYIAGEHTGYDFMTLTEAKEIILDLFKDINYMTEADRSRSVASLLMPAMNSAGFFKSTRVPITYIEADQSGGGKGMLVRILSTPYVDSPVVITQKEGSIGSMEEDVASAALKGNYFLNFDNLKASGKMKTFSSPFLEALTAEDKITGRIAYEGNYNLDPRNLTLYATSNGISLSPDLADRSLCITMRKHSPDYKWKRPYNEIAPYITENRPRIMSAIFTCIRDWVLRGKPELKGEIHRFSGSVDKVNEIVTHVFELPSITEGHTNMKRRLADPNLEILRQLCFCIQARGMLDTPIGYLDMAEALDDSDKGDLIGLGSDDIIADENGMPSAETKQKASRVLGKLFGRPNILGRLPKKARIDTFCFEEFRIHRERNMAKDGITLYKFERQNENT